MINFPSEGAKMFKRGHAIRQKKREQRRQSLKAAGSDMGFPLYVTAALPESREQILDGEYSIAYRLPYEHTEKLPVGYAPETIMLMFLANILGFTILHGGRMLARECSNLPYLRGGLEIVLAFPSQQHGDEAILALEAFQDGTSMSPWKVSEDSQSISQLRPFSSFLSDTEMIELMRYAIKLQFRGRAILSRTMLTEQYEEQFEYGRIKVRRRLTEPGTKGM
jgi:hypothetical protein